MTWNYYNDEEIKKSESFSMFMRVSAILEKNGEDVQSNEIGISERELHGMVEDILKQAIGEKYSTEVQGEDGEETVIEVTIEDITENR